MFSKTSAVFALAALLAISCLVSALPRCDRDDEECKDRNMHPDLPPMPKKFQRALEGENSNDYWRNVAHEFINKQLNTAPNKNRAKNVIMFLGDGMGLTTIAAARNLLGGEEQNLSFNKFPHTGLAKTYSVDKIVPDSACTSTAYLSGVKAQEGTLGVNGNVDMGDCQAGADRSNWVYSIAKWAQDAGKSTGVVTTTRITHASPGGVYAHIAHRDWENDQEVNVECGINSGVEDIAYQLIKGEIGSKLDFVMGGGKKHFIDSSLYENGRRKDGLNLVEEYKKQSAKNLYIETRDELMSSNLLDYDRVFGLYQDDHMLYHLETNETTNQPTLEEMTRKAIEFLSRNENGYFIFIEGGRIDLAHHQNMARIALDETVEFSKAIAAAQEMTNEEDTLIVVTADHSHSFSYNGYPYRGKDVFGRTPAIPDDGIPYMTLSYANGPSYEKSFDTKNGHRIDPTTVITGDKYDQFPSAMPFEDETHGGDDVAVYANGPWSHLFSGVYEQNTIPHIMGYASCLGNGLKMCNSN
ncbi:alkaline phosphatase [Lucilia sericata]|uniref:alkaline phosphatase n=1 Tax=Lucilia sericata TaxID=13632 RepID=UPI0018A8605F|nr:alkaline phosphatase [Lucilia sericata]